MRALPPAGKLRFNAYGPARRLGLKSTAITQVDVSPDQTQATALGTAKINGTGPVEFRVDVQDLPGAPDTFRISLGDSSTTRASRVSATATSTSSAVMGITTGGATTATVTTTRVGTRAAGRSSGAGSRLGPRARGRPRPAPLPEPHVLPLVADARLDHEALLARRARRLEHAQDLLEALEPLLVRR